MAGVVLEIAAKDKDTVPVEIVRRYRGRHRCQRFLGTINQRFCSYQLSDLLTPWEKKERRLEAVSSATVHCALYPQSHDRIEPLAKAYR
jgi:precorrin-3B methylase